MSCHLQLQDFDLSATAQVGAHLEGRRHDQSSVRTVKSRRDKCPETIQMKTCQQCDRLGDF